MTPGDLLRLCHRCGISVHVDADELVLRAREEIPDGILQALRYHKQEMIRFLLVAGGSYPCSHACGRTPVYPLPDWVCFWCRPKPIEA